MKRIILIWLLTVNCVLANAQFTVIPTGTSDPLGYIRRFGNVCIVQGWNNYFLKSSNFYNTSQVLSVPSSPNFENKIHVTDNFLFLSSSDLASEHSLIWKSLDTGNQWTLQLDTIGYYSDDLLMFDDNNGVSIGMIYQSIRTQDGGQVWMSNSTNIYTSLFETRFNDSIGVWTSIEKIYLTYNQGYSTILSSNGNLLNPQGCQILSPDTILLTSLSQGNYFVYTTDSAKSWQSIETSPFSGRGMYFFNGQEGYVVGRDYQAGKGAVYKTTNLGQTWIKYLTEIDCTLTDIEFMNDSIAIITGTNGVLLRWNKHGAPTEVETFNSRLDVSITPNPSNNEHMLKLSIQQLKSIPCCTLLDVSGRELAVYTMESKGQGEYALKNNTASLPNGLYFYKVEVDGITYTVKFIVTH